MSAFIEDFLTIIFVEILFLKSKFDLNIKNHDLTIEDTIPTMLRATDEVTLV